MDDTQTPERLRPSTLDDFAGQPDVVEQLRVVLGAARTRGDVVCPHLLFAGPPGLGKTTLAHIIASELGLPLTTTSGPAIDKPGALAALLVSLPGPAVVFIDEIHRLPPTVQEMLYSAMEDQRIDILVSEDATKAVAYPMELEPFVLVGATTESGRLARPFLDRFGYVGRLELYSPEILTEIVHRSARVLGAQISDDAAAMIAARSRGTPRVANQLLGRVRDVATIRGATIIDEATAAAGLDVFGIDSHGLSKVDRQLLTTLVTAFSGGPVGLTTLAAAVNEDPVTIEASHEPFLMRSGLIARTPRGRTATAGTYRHLGLPVPDHLQNALFD